MIKNLFHNKLYYGLIFGWVILSILYDPDVTLPTLVAGSILIGLPILEVLNKTFMGSYRFSKEAELWIEENAELIEKIAHKKTEFILQDSIKKNNP